MVRILGNNFSNKKKIYVALTCIYGIGIPTSKKILATLNIDPDIKVSELKEENVSALRDLLETEEFKLEGDLKRLISLNIKRLIDINSLKFNPIFSEFRFSFSTSFSNFLITFSQSRDSNTRFFIKSIS